jgi:hypothetical protein
MLPKSVFRKTEEVTCGSQKRKREVKANGASGYPREFPEFMRSLLIAFSIL